MKRQKRLTKRERKAQSEGQTVSSAAAKKDAPHIHCIECGRHLNPGEFLSGEANWLKCQHGTKYASCKVCVSGAMKRLRVHDETGTQVEIAEVWH